MQDTDLTSKVLGWLDDSIKDINRILWQHTVIAESGIVFTEGQQWITVGSNIYRESQAYLTHNTSGDQPPLTYEPWVVFKRKYPGTDTSGPDLGLPQIYTIFNTDKDDRIYLYPIPNSDTVTNYTLTVEYYQRLPLISSCANNEPPRIPQEFENAILYGAYKRFAMDMGESAQVGLYENLEHEEHQYLKNMNGMHPDAQKGFRVFHEKFHPNRVVRRFSPW